MEELNGAFDPNTQPPIVKDQNVDLLVPEEMQLEMRRDYMTGRFTCEQLATKYSVDPRIIAWLIRKKNWLRDMVARGIIPVYDKMLSSGTKKRYGLRGVRGPEFENELRRAFMDIGTPVEAIARRFGISVDSLRKKAINSGWMAVRRDIFDKTMKDPRLKIEYSMSGMIEEAACHVRRLIRMEQEFPGEVMGSKDFQKLLDSFADMCRSAAVLMTNAPNPSVEDIPKKAPTVDIPIALRMAPVLKRQ